jgi:hypothetical protein
MRGSASTRSSPTSAAPTPSSSSAGRCAACAPISAGCSATLSARPAATRPCARSSPMSLAFRVRHQRQNQRGRKVYSLHAPEVECIGKGKAHRPYEFGVKVSVATTLVRSKGGQFIAHVKALPGTPYDGHTLATLIPEIETSSARAPPASSPTAATAATTRPRPQAEGLHLRPEARRHGGDQARLAPSLGGRAHHRPRQERAPHGPQLPQGNPRRRRQRRPRRRRLQLRRLLAWLAALWRVLIMALLADAHGAPLPGSATPDFSSPRRKSRTPPTSRSTKSTARISSDLQLTTLRKLKLRGIR